MVFARTLSNLMQVTPAWLSEALSQGGLPVTAAELTELTLEPLGGGRGNLASLARLHLSSGGPPVAKLPSTLVLKIAPEAKSSLVRSWRLGRREAFFYRTFGGRGPLRAPRCYFADSDPRTGDFTIVLEDLSAAASADQRVGATLEQAQIAVEALAQHHVHFWQHEALVKHSDWLPLPNANRDAVLFFVKRSWQSCANRYPTLPTSSQQSLLALERNYGALLDRVSTAPVTLLHGDFRLDNMFFASESWKTCFAVADWQLVAQGRGPWDLGNFLVGSLTSATRSACQLELVRRYYSIIQPACGDAYTFADCVADCDAGIVGSFTMAAILADTQWRASNWVAKVVEDWLERSASAVVEVLSHFE